MTIFRAFGRHIDKIKPVDIKIDQNEDFEIITQRNQQREVFEENRNSKYFQLIQPPGSGKSINVAFVMADRLKNNPNMKVVIAVPQTFIAKSFGKMILQYDDGTQINWDCFHDLCKKSNLQKIKYLTKFLKKKEFEPGIENRVAIVTHSTLAQTYSKVSKFNDIFDNTTIVIDEAHHIMYEDNETSNRIGSMVNHIFKNKSDSSLWLVTATPYRGDSNSIIPKEILDTFDKHFLPLDKHWEENIKYIEDFTFNFVIYKQYEIFDEVKKVFKLGHKKSIIFCPYVGHLMNDSNKNKFKDKLIKTIKEEWHDCKILDLIETNGRDKRKEILLDNRDAKHVDVILTLKIFDEGSDWVHAEQCLDLAPSNTLRITHQRFGRLWRDFFNKKSIIYYCFLPFESKFKNEEERRIHLSKSFNALATSLLLQDIIEPIKYPTKLKSNNRRELYINPLEEIFPDDDERAKLLENIIKKLIVMKSVSEDPSAQDVKQWIKCLLTSENIIKNQDQIINHIGLVFRKMHNQKHIIKSIDYSKNNSNYFIEDFDKIWLNDIFEDLRIFGTNTCTSKTFQEFRDVIKGERKSIEEWVQIAEKLTEENGGKLPPSKWLRENGYNGLEICLYKYKNSFKHILKENLYKERNSPEDWVKIAEKLAKDNGGKLQSYIWLKRNGYMGLTALLYSKHKKMFDHIKRKYDSMPPEKWLKIAENLVKDNGGKLPPATWLIENGYSNLLYHLNKKSFSHIDRDFINDPCKSLDEWIEIAEKLAKDNGGKLPPVKWLRKNGYGRLVNHLCINKKSFSHIDRDFINDPCKSLDEWIEIAEKLAKDNGGKLPSLSWLKTNGYRKLYQCIISNRDTFSHIKRNDNNLKSLDEWIEIAEKLAKDNGGKLPPAKWLRENGHKRLVVYLSLNKKSFSHIDRDFMVNPSKSFEDWLEIAEILAKDNGGKLPPATWLKKNGYYGLVNRIYKKKELFQHILR